MGASYSKEEKECFLKWEPQMSQACRNPDTFYPVLDKIQQALNTNDS